MALYSLLGSRPAALPFRISLPDGSTRTDPDSFEEEDIAAAGFVLAPSSPEYDSGSERLGWVNGEWQVEALPAPVDEAIVAERDRRLSFGFYYDFGDARGVHRIGTAADDMRKWMDEVTPIAQALINAGQSGAEIGISTDTGPVVITAMDWQLILLAAGQWRQPLYQASFELLAADPRPYDYIDDRHWPKGRDPGTSPG
ncbi:hypothetical protein [Shinella sp.]|uniref:hypothetical protein n=1 Tax=Shinella sp. TaxID=1870904 RepID=UPI0029B19169|nr:hypothetical protein [Shinella sp.]MDX3973313.1 hypothetical protein [Shinella sp.]